MTIWDHALFVLLAGVLPVLALWRMPTNDAPADDFQGIDRSRTYLLTAVQLVAAAGTVIGLWLGLSRPLGDLFLAVPSEGPAFWIVSGLLVAAGFIGLAIVGAARRMPRVRGFLRGYVADSLKGLLGELMPRTPGELFTFNAILWPAALAEELLFRAFLYWYLSMLLPWWAAVLIASILFGACHGYQGFVGIAKTAGLGLLLALVTIATGSLWLAVALHVLINAVSGALVYLYLVEGPDQESDAF